ncbi:MAG TPA: SCO family protein [Mycobacteriales bacterium]|nr:SCO family protein [Mycobacteriales bacterium]
MRRHPIPLLAGPVAAVLLLAGCAGTASPSGPKAGPPVSVSTPRALFDGAQLATPTRRPSFTLTDTAGRSYDFNARTAGRPTFLYFGYTHCPDVCPTTMANIATALREVPAQIRAKVDVVFVTTDPSRDTPPVVGAWLSHFDGDLARKFVGLTGSQAQLDTAQQAAGVPLAQDGGQTHSAQVMLYGPDNLARVFYLEGSSSDDMVHDLPLIAEGRHQ